MQLTQQVLSKKYKRIPFDPDDFRKRLESSSPHELEEMNAALTVRSLAIQKHVELIKQLEDEQLGRLGPRGISHQAC